MFASQNSHPALRPPLFSANSAPSALKSPPNQATTQLLPSFSTPSKHSTRTNACNSFPLYALLHSSLCTPGRGYTRSSFARAVGLQRLVRPAPRSACASVTPVNATLTSPPVAAQPSTPPLPHGTRDIGHGPRVTSYGTRTMQAHPQIRYTTPPSTP